jgi:hypothetical protein
VRLITSLLLLLSLPAFAGNFRADSFLANDSVVYYDPADQLHKVTVQSPTRAADWILTWPQNDGSANQCLTTDGNGNTSWATPVDTGVTTMGAFGSSPNSNGGTISGVTLTLQPADGTNPGGVSTTTQTFAGAKTFSSTPTFSTMTVGSVLFSGTSGILSQDNSNFFWDDTNNWHGIGTATPAYKLHVKTAGNNETAMRLQPSAGSGNDIDFRFEGTNSPTFRIDRGAGTLLLFNSGNMNLNATANPVWNVQHNAAATQTSIANYMLRDQGYPVVAVKNSSATANNAAGIVFAGSGNDSTEATSGIFGVQESHSAGAETGHLEFWARNAGTAARKMNIAKDGVVTLDAYTAGALSTDSSGVISAGTLSVTNGGTGQSSYTDGQLLIGNSTGNTRAKSTLTAGSGISITNGSGSITIAATGGGGGVCTPLVKTTDYTVQSSDFTGCSQLDVRMNCSSDCTLTLQSPAGAGNIVNVKSANTGQVTVSGTIDGDTSYIMPIQYQSASFHDSGGSEWAVF